VSVSAQIGRERPEQPRRMSNGKRPNFPVWMTAKTMTESFEEFRALTKHLFDEGDRRDVVVILDGIDELPEEQRLEASSRIYNTSASWLNLVERWFAAITEKQIRRGSFRSTRELEQAIRTFLNLHNAQPKPFVWSKSADDILNSIARYCRRINDSGH
jgi:hypothetical protein